MDTIDVDFLPGDPVIHIVGKPEEKPAKKHAKQKPKPIKTARGMLADIELRLQELEPLMQEYEVLKGVRDILTGKK